MARCCAAVYGSVPGSRETLRDEAVFRHDKANAGGKRRVSLLAELKRRNVLRVAALYAAVAWLLLQVGDVVVEPLELPAWTMKLLIVLLAAGFLVAVAVAWAFELTPEGLKRDPGPAGPASGSSRTVQRGINVAIAVTLAAALGYFAVTRIVLDDEEPSGTPTTGVKTLAVLPFANLSSDPDDGYFADGLSEELLNLLARIEGLKVTGRTSSFYFKGRNEDLRAIGRQLGVAHILEGSVRRAGTRVRVTAQLINADDGFHLWSETYDRELSDVLALQDEIGRKVADALEVELLGSAAQDARPDRSNVDAEAYRLYLVARSRLRERGLDNLRSALKLFQEARQRDPTFAAAHAGEAIALGLLWSNHGDGDPAAPYAQPEAAARKALELDPRSSDAHAALGRTLMERATFEDGSYDEAGRHLERAVDLDPGNAVALYWLARFEGFAGSPERALQLFDQVLELDPLEFIAGSGRAELLSRLGRGPEALQEFQRLVGIYPDNPTLLNNYAEVAIAWGQMSRALQLLEQGGRHGAAVWSNLHFAAIHGSWGDEAGAREAAARITGSAVADWTRNALVAGMDRDYEKLYRIDEAFASAAGSQSTVAEGALMYSAALTDRWDVVERLSRRRFARAYADPPEITVDLICPASIVAKARRHRGDAEGARQISEAALVAWEGNRALRTPDDLVCRSRLLVAAGRTNDALETFTQAVDAGFRNLMVDYVLWLRDDLLLRELNGDPRYEAQWKRIETDLARQRAEHEAAKRKAASP